MTTERRLERDLPSILGDLAMGPYPDYIDDVFAITAQRRQRPAWTFIERWLPMDIAATRVSTARLPLRTLGVLALIAVLTAAALVAYVGSRPARLPAPFGPAANGYVAYADQGDIYTVDPVSGVATAIVTGPETDFAPVWSRDGTHVVFERRGINLSGSKLYVARSDGREVIAVTPEPIDRLGSYSFSPDGREIAFTSAPGTSKIWIAMADGSGIRQLDVGMSMKEPSYGPPDGAEIVFAGDAPIAAGDGLYAVNVETGAVRIILAPERGVSREWIRVSPDGSRIAYSAFTSDPDRNTFMVHIVRADGSEDMTLPMPQGATFQDAPEWSNDGTRLVVVRGYALRNQDMTLAAVPADGTGVGVETDRGLTGCCDAKNEWAPNDRSILTAPFDLSGRPLYQLLWDPLTGVLQPAPWTAKSPPAWQRTAP